MDAAEWLMTIELVNVTVANGYRSQSNVIINRWMSKGTTVYSTTYKKNDPLPMAVHNRGFLLMNSLSSWLQLRPLRLLLT